MSKQNLKDKIVIHTPDDFTAFERHYVTSMLNAVEVLAKTAKSQGIELKTKNTHDSQ